MISKEEEKRVMEFSVEYSKRAELISKYRDELTILQEKIGKEISEMQKIQENEFKFLDDLRIKYNSTPDEVIQLIQKIVMNTEK